VTCRVDYCSIASDWRDLGGLARALTRVFDKITSPRLSFCRLDYYLGILVRKPGEPPDSALAQARAGGAFTSAREAFWSAAQARHGDAARPGRLSRYCRCCTGGCPPRA
jgi:hypothetical protein